MSLVLIPGRLLHLSESLSTFYEQVYNDQDDGDEAQMSQRDRATPLTVVYHHFPARPTSRYQSVY